MAYASYHNGELTNGAGEQVRPRIAGFFREAEYGNAFEYTERLVNKNTVAGAWGTNALPHFVCVGLGEVRFARVLKTVAYVVVDEDAHGDPVFEKWSIKGHRVYAK